MHKTKSKKITRKGGAVIEEDVSDNEKDQLPQFVTPSDVSIEEVIDDSKPLGNIGLFLYLFYSYYTHIICKLI